MGVLTALFRVAFFVVGFVQLIATADGMQWLTHWHWMVCWAIALLLGWSPLIGTALGVYGATHAWDWPWYWAIALFTWHLILFGSIYGGAALYGKLKRR